MRVKDTNVFVADETQPKKNPSHHRQLRWDKLDNTAHLFPVIAGEEVTNVYRISVTLKELVDPDILQRALDIVLPKFDGFNMCLRQGFFWFYFEENTKPAPSISEESKFPCRYIRPNKNNSYMFRVSYYRYRINLEVFHVLTDGMGGVNFLKELTYQYLRLAHPEISGEKGDRLKGGTTLNREDSFVKNYKRKSPPKYKTQKAYMIKGEEHRRGTFGAMHGYLNIPQLKEVCKKHGVTINDYLISVYIWSVYNECLHKRPSKLPIRVAVPVNLRPYFGSITTKNFFVMVGADFLPTRDNHTFEDVVAAVKESLKSQINAQHLEEIFSYNVSNQENFLLRILPLPLKHIGMKIIYNRSVRANTSTITNIGKIDIPSPYKEYIDKFHAFMAISKGQRIKGSICSFEDTLVFTFSYNMCDVSVQKGFFRKLAEDGLDVEIESNGVSYG